jgi:hypothetical protein
MFYRETIAVGSEIYTKCLHTFSGQGTEVLNVKPFAT